MYKEKNQKYVGNNIVYNANRPISGVGAKLNRINTPDKLIRKDILIKQVNNKDRILIKPNIDINIRPRTPDINRSPVNKNLLIKKK